MRFSRPDVACNASRFLGPKDPNMTKANWMKNLNDDLERGTRNHNRSRSLQKLTQLGHGTWSHFSLGDAVGSFKIDRALYGDTEARSRHLARAERSGQLWQHPQAAQLPLPESAAELSKAPLDASSTRSPPPPDAGSPDKERSIPVPSAPRIESRREPPAPVPGSADPSAISTRENRKYQRREAAPELPQLWMAQPRSMTPHTPYTAASTGRTGGSVTPACAVGVSQLADRLGPQISLRPPLRRVESDPCFSRGPQGYIDPSLRLRPSPPVSGSSAPDGARGFSTFTFG